MHTEEMQKGAPAFSEHLSFYIKKFGILPLFWKVLVKGWRTVFVRSEWMYHIDLKDDQRCNGVDSTLSMTSFMTAEEVDVRSFNQLKEFKSELTISRFLNRFFSRGACLWLIRVDEDIAGVLWTLPGGFDGFYSIPIASDEVIILAVEVFSKYRGKGLFPKSLNTLCQALKERGYRSAYLKVAFWNKSMQRSMGKVPWEILGNVITFKLGTCYVTAWRHVSHCSKRKLMPSAKSGFAKIW